MQDRQKDRDAPRSCCGIAACALFVAAGVQCFFWAPGIAQADPPPIAFAYVGDSAHGAYQGALQGLKEANLQGRFLGRSYELSAYASIGALADAAEAPVAIFGVLEREGLLSLADSFPGVPVMNLSLDADELRTACQSASVLHVPPSQRMKKDAVDQWRQAHPEQQDLLQAQAWHPDFLKFAARDLNKRFRASFHQPMDDASWAGWAAVRMVAEALNRERLHAPGALLEYLRTRLAFDGQKGAPMSFRDTGQLRQPLLLVRAGELIGEAPVRGVAAAIDLDSLGLPACP